MKDLIAGTVAYVKEVLQGAEGGHDWFHTERVWKMARYIREMEDRGDLAVIEPAALLHDIADPKFFEGDLEKGPQMAFDFLDRAGLDSDRVRLVTGIIRNISFKGGIIYEPVNSVEFGIVQDADRLDAMGAIGIARAFHYGGFRNRPIHDPSVPFREYRDT
ncbi:MAG: HD domain-containing protein, partial [Bacteroidetes bacterium]